VGIANKFDQDEVLGGKGEGGNRKQVAGYVKWRPRHTSQRSGLDAVNQSINPAPPNSSWGNRTSPHASTTGRGIVQRSAAQHYLCARRR
jgi:hypothetical protein